MRISLIILSTLLCLLQACNSTKKSVYFHKVENLSIDNSIDKAAPIIQKNDLLDVTISSLNPEASEVFNSSNAPAGYTATYSGSITKSFGYMVDQEGNIQLPILGNIKADGLTQKQLKDTITKKITTSKLLLDPIVSIRFLNFKISIMGEVERPSVYNIPTEKITILEALALAGDMTEYSKRNNVVLIREENGKKNLIRLDLSTAKIFESPYYYLKSNDIVYVEHNRAKVASTRPIAPWLSAVFSGTSLIIVVIDRVILK